MTKKLSNIIIATGGTGGHVFPAYNLAKHFINKKINVELISDKRGLKYLNSYNDIKITEISTSPILKENFFKFIISIIIILYSIFRSLIFFLFNRPDFVFGMGGYSSFPVCIAAKILAIPFIIYENNLFIGKANKYLLPFTNKIFVSSEYLEGIHKKYKNKVCKIGNIIRKEIINFGENRNNNYEYNEIRILILGGSQAAKVFAKELPEIFKKCQHNKIPLKIYQQCLPEQNEYLKTFYKNLNIDFEVFNFSENILEYFEKVNLAITRSGSSMLAELLNAKIPFISVPLPTSADNHQLKNAIYYEKNHYGYLIEEKDLDKKLFKLIKLIHEGRSVITQIINKQKKYSDKSVYRDIDKEMIKIINEKN